MKILGIETSCDETAAAIIENGTTILSNVVASSLKEHQAYGGVIPEIASRRQLECIQAVVDTALSQANVTFDDIDAIAVTKSPGLIGSLLVGYNFAQSLSYALNKPLIDVNHVEAHLFANFLTYKDPNKNSSTEPQIPPQLPAVGLVVSGGHTNLYYVENYTQLKRLGETLDDAAGEAFDKVARILELGYPGGPVIDKEAQKSQNNTIHFNCALLPNTFNFSFSGIKTAVLYYHRDHHDQPGYSKADMADAFQTSVINVLVKKCLQACQEMNTQTLLIGGGVAANSYFRKQLKNLAENHDINVYYPPMSLCTDNAAMIGGLGYHLWQATKEPL